MSPTPSPTAVATMATLFDLFCKPRSHDHPTSEAWICGEAVLARTPGSTGLAELHPVQAPPRLIDFHNAGCQPDQHPHAAAAAGKCVDRVLRARMEANVERLNDAVERAAMAARTSNDDSSSTNAIATQTVVGRGPYGYKTGSRPHPQSEGSSEGSA